MTVDEYLALRQKLIDLGYEKEIHWAQNIAPVSDALEFWREYGWVLVNSGMRAQVARTIWERVRPAVEAGGSAHQVFGHKGKAGAIDALYARREAVLADYLGATDKIAFLLGLEWIGPIVVWHLAKNLGIDCAKPDRHLVRIAGREGVDALCRRLADATGDRVAAVDTVIWRAANLRLV